MLVVLHFWFHCGTAISLLTVENKMTKKRPSVTPLTWVFPSALPHNLYILIQIFFLLVERAQELLSNLLPAPSMHCIVQQKNKAQIAQHAAHDTKLESSEWRLQILALSTCILWGGRLQKQRKCFWHSWSFHTASPNNWSKTSTVYLLSVWTFVLVLLQLLLPLIISVPEANLPGRNVQHAAAFF